MSFLTQETVINPNRSEAESQTFEVARDEDALVNARTEEANMETPLANTRADKAKAKTAKSANQFEVFKKQMFDLWQSIQVATSIAPSTNHEYESDVPLTGVDVSSEYA